MSNEFCGEPRVVGSRFECRPAPFCHPRRGFFWSRGRPDPHDFRQSLGAQDWREAVRGIKGVGRREDCQPVHYQTHGHQDGRIDESVGIGRGKPSKNAQALIGVLEYFAEDDVVTKCLPIPVPCGLLRAPRHFDTGQCGFGLLDPRLEPFCLSRLRLIRLDDFQMLTEQQTRSCATGQSI